MIRQSGEPVLMMYWLVTPGWSTSCTAAAKIVANISISVNTFYNSNNRWGDVI